MMSSRPSPFMSPTILDQGLDGGEASAVSSVNGTAGAAAGEAGYPPRITRSTAADTEIGNLLADVMDKVGYPRGLIKYSTQNGVAQGWTRAQMLKRAFRPRVLVYTATLGLITLAVFVSLFLRTPLKVDVIRDRGALARMVEQGRIENVYRLQVMNATESTQRYTVTVSGIPGITLDPSADIEVLPTEVRAAAVRVQIPPNGAEPGSHPITFEVKSSSDDSVRVVEKSVFLVPR